MKKIVVFLAFAAVAFAAEPAKKKAKPAPAPQAVTIPKDAVPNADGNSYTYTDKDGRKWIYAKTPFGIMKSPASETADAAPTALDPATTKAIDKGDSVRFEKPGPFGTIAWEKKKTDLNDSERNVLDAQKAKQQ
jgi:hypothetical protein